MVKVFKVKVKVKYLKLAVHTQVKGSRSNTVIWLFMPLALAVLMGLSSNLPGILKPSRGFHSAKNDDLSQGQDQIL